MPKAIEDALERRDVRVVLIDEIGKMELFSKRFRNVVRKALDSDKVVIGVLGRARDPLVYAIRNRDDTLVIELPRHASKNQREKIKQSILDAIFSALERRKQTLDDFINAP